MKASNAKQDSALYPLFFCIRCTLLLFEHVYYILEHLEFNLDTRDHSHHPFMIPPYLTSGVDVINITAGNNVPK